MASIQLVFIRGENKRVYYGEIADGHIFRSPQRELFQEDITFIKPDSKWITFGKGRVFEIESDSGWTKAYVVDVQYICKTSSGYIIPCFLMNRLPSMISWPKLGRKSVAAPVAPVPPPVIRRTCAAPKSAARKRRDSMSSTVVVLGAASLT